MITYWGPTCTCMFSLKTEEIYNSIAMTKLTRYNSHW